MDHILTSPTCHAESTITGDSALQFHGFPVLLLGITGSVSFLVSIEIEALKNVLVGVCLFVRFLVRCKGGGENVLNVIELIIVIKMQLIINAIFEWFEALGQVGVKCLDCLFLKISSDEPFNVSDFRQDDVEPFNPCIGVAGIISVDD